MNEQDYLEMQRLKNNLYHYFRHTYAGRASVALLFQKGREIENKITSLDEFYESKEFGTLEKVFSFIDQLHDKFTRDYVSSNRNELLAYLEKLKK